jgi:hypothetical protein
MDSERGRPHPVEGRRLAAALQVAEHDGPHVAMEPPGQLIRHVLADSTKPDLMPHSVGFAVHEPSVRQVCSLGHDNQREPLALGLASSSGRC